LLLQVPAWFGVEHSRALSLTGCILCFVSLVAYCSYHVSDHYVTKHFVMGRLYSTGWCEYGRHLG
jgi:hypothetical protein